MRRNQLALDDFGKGVGRFIAEERRDLLWFGRQTDQVEVGAANERAFVRLRRRSQAFGFQFGQNESVYWRLPPALVSHHRKGRRFDWLKGPVRAGFGGNRFGFSSILIFARARIGCAHAHPRLQRGHLLGRKPFAFRWHLQIFVSVPDRFNQQTFFRVTGHNGRAGVSTLEQALTSIEQKSAFNFLRFAAVAVITMLDENGPYLLLEKLQPGSIGRL